MFRSILFASAFMVAASAANAGVVHDHHKGRCDEGTYNKTTRECDVHLAGANGVPRHIDNDQWCKEHGPGATHDVTVDLDGIQATAHYKCR